MENKYGKAERVWVFDRGVVSEENLEELRCRKTSYVVGTPRSMLKKFEQAFINKDWHEVEAGIEVKTLTCPGYRAETFILCKSEGRKEKESAILERQKERLEKELFKIRNGIRSGRLRNEQKIAFRIGRWLGRYTKAKPLFEIKLIKDKKGAIIDLNIDYKKERGEWAKKIHGKYLLRTNINESDPKRLWKIYIQLNQAENAFRMSKSDLRLRPIFHQKADRVQAHIFICFIALAMWKTLELWMNASGLGRSPMKLMEEFREIHSLDIIVPIKDRPSLKLRIIGKPDTHVRILLHKMGIKLPSRPILAKNVVQTLGV